MIIFFKKLSSFLSTKIVSFSTVSINFFSLIIEENKSILDVLKKDLPLSSEYGTTMVVKKICIINFNKSK